MTLSAFAWGYFCIGMALLIVVLTLNEGAQQEVRRYRTVSVFFGCAMLVLLWPVAVIVWIVAAVIAFVLMVSRP